MPGPLPPSPFQRGPKVGRERRFDVDRFRGERMRKGKPCGVEELPFEPEVAFDAVGRIAGDGKVDRGEMDPDLMRAAGHEARPEKGVTGEELNELKVGDRLAGRSRVERHPGRITPVAADRSLDPSEARAGPAPYEHEVFADQLPPAQHPLQTPVGLLRACDNEQAGGVPVQAMDDARPFRLSSTRDRAAQEAVDERPAGMPCRRVDDDARRLVHHEEVLVLPRNAKIELFRLKLARAALWNIERELLPWIQTMALRPRRAVYEHAAFLNEPLRRRARADILEEREEAVEPLAGRLRRHGEGAFNHLF